MNDMAETMLWRSREMVQGWSLSLLLHLVLVFTAVTIMPKMTLVIEPEPFRWDVALVEPSHEVVHEEVPSPVAKAQPPKPAPVQPVRPIEPPIETVIARVAPQQSPQVVHPAVESPKPQQPVEPVQQVVRAETKPREPEPVRKEEVKEPAPVVKEVTSAIAPVARAYTYQAPASTVHPSAVERHETHAASVASALTAEPTAASSVPSPSAAAPAEPVAAAPVAVMHEPAQVAASAPTPRAATKADYGWLAESLGRRIAALTHYPSSARMNGWEGRVVLRAVIRADGQLADVTVQKSSGYEVLDRAALETIKLACPLHMKHQLSATEVAVNVPIVYSLAN